MWNHGNDQLPVGACCPLEVEAAEFNGGRPCRCDEDCQLRRLYEYLRRLPLDFNRGNEDVAGVSTNCSGNQVCGCGCGCGCGCWHCCRRCCQ